MSQRTQFLLAKARGVSAASRGGGTGRSSLPADLIQQSSRRLGLICLIYAVAFFLANFLTAILAGKIRDEFSSFGNWAPGVISIAVSLIVFGITKNPRISPKNLMNLGLLFMVAGSFGIAFAEYWGFLSGTPVNAESLGHFGLSWVAVWMISFTVVVPNPPGRSLVASLAAAGAVPITIGLSMKYGGTMLVISPGVFFIGVVFPYIICAGMAYAAAGVIYRLGADVRRAREMGSYILEDRIGEGGMGEVWKARHRMLARPAAVKLIRADTSGSGERKEGTSLLKRFEHEAQATAALRSPHTIEVYDFGLSDEGTFYYVMELLDGFDLDTLVTRFGPQPPERVVPMLIQACHSLHEAHSAGLVHRDIKPANLFICRYGSDFDFVKVLDFGLVAERKAGGGDATRATMPGMIVGSPAFMAPEMVSEGSRLDGRADLYGLGCVAYWLLTGQQLFKAESTMEVIVRHARDIPEPPSSRSEMVIPAGLDQIVMDCLEKDPARRPQTAGDLADRLRGLSLDGGWTTDHRARWWQTHAPRSPKPV